VAFQFEVMDHPSGMIHNLVGTSCQRMEEQSDDPAGAPFSTLHAKEWYRTTGFKELALVYGSTEKSYRKTSDLINRVRHQEDATPSRTLRENTECEGRQIMAHVEQQAVEILHEHGFTTDGTPTKIGVDTYIILFLIPISSFS